MRKLPELLAPAGSFDALRAAVAAGADAVYLSGKRFGARKFAVNFDEPELTKAIDFAHLRDVRVYVTVNTLVREEELSDVAEYLLWLYEMGADAVLVQDLGVAALAHKLVPELELHASTQMTIHNREGAIFAARLGFRRVVLAREVTMDEIKKMKEEMKTSGPGLEIFVHGALCYCYSGQCLLSSAIGGRSGNRGMCAQPCRKSYVLLHGKLDEYGRPIHTMAEPLKENFLISTRDLSIYKHLDRIVRLPLQSLKIEGRMKSPEYVAIVTSIYRKALDRIAKGSWSPSPEDERDLALAFNRDFTEGHILAAKDVMGRQMSDNRGLFIGSVVSSNTQKGEANVRLSGQRVPKSGDGLVFLAPGQEIGLIVQRPLLKDGLLRLKTPERVHPGAKVYITSSIDLTQKAQQVIASAKTEIPIDLHIAWENGTPQAIGQLANGLRVQAKSEFRMETAKNQPATRQQIESQMRKTGGTPFVVKNVEIDDPGDIFIPIGALNKLRRDLLKEAEDILLSIHRPDQEIVKSARKRLSQMSLETLARPESRVPSLAVYADNLETVQGAILGGCRRIYFEPFIGQIQVDRSKETLKLLDKAKDICSEAELIWKWPKITKEEYLRFARFLLDKIATDGVMVENIGASEAVLATSPNAYLFGASGLNVWNHLTVEQLSPPFRLLTLSPELSRDQLTKTIAASQLCRNAPRLELIMQGNLEVMVAEDCIPCLAKGKTMPDRFWGLQDFKHVFPIRQDDDKRTHVFNSAETCLLDFMPEIFKMGIDGVAVDARGRTKKYAKEMTEIYIKAINLTKKGGGSLQEELRGLKEYIRPMALGGLTFGHFVKGLKDEIS